MILTYLNIVLIILLGDMSHTIRVAVSCLFVMINPVEGVLVKKPTTAKILQCGFYWPTLFKDAYDYYKRCPRCHQLGHITDKDMMALNPIIMVEIFDVWGIYFLWDVLDLF